MAGFFRRAGGQIARFLSSISDPAAVAAEYSLYQKLDSGKTQLFGTGDDGIVVQLGIGTIVANTIASTAPRCN